jgi:hypothetical protein
MVINTKQLLSNLSKAIQKENEKFGPGKQLSVMMNSNENEDPHEACTHIMTIVREPERILIETPTFGVQVDNIMKCKKCGNSRVCNDDEKFITGPLDLYALRDPNFLSTQSALQQLLEPYDVAVDCNQGKYTQHTKYTECIQVQNGLVLYSTITGDIIQDFKNRKVVVDSTIRLPFDGPDSKLQSVLKLTGYTVRPVDTDSTGHTTWQSWTYDDDTVKKGLPKEHCVPLLMFYERVQTEAPKKNIHFASLQPKAQGKSPKD